MIKKKSDIQGEVLTNFKGGIGHITIFPFLTEQESKGAGRLFAKSVIEPGNSIGIHQHEGDMETYYILRGKALLLDNDSEIILESGDCHICPDGRAHSIKNIGDDTLEYIALILYTNQKTSKHIS